MDAWVNDIGIRLKGLGQFQATSPKGTLDALLDKLKARTLKNGKRIYMQSADDGVLHHTIPSAEAVKILQASGVGTHYAQSPITDKLRGHLLKCQHAIQSARLIVRKHEYRDDYRSMIVIGFISIPLQSVSPRQKRSQPYHAQQAIQPPRGAQQGFYAEIEGMRETIETTARDRISL